MFGSQVLEIVIGLVFIYLVLSIACSGLKEVIARITDMRAKTLEEALRNMLKNGDNNLVPALYAHPLIASTARPGKKPAYIASRSFAGALLDVLAPLPGAQPRTLQDLRNGVGNLPASPLRTTLFGLVDSCEGDMDKARKKIEHWFDDTMDRVSGWYKRRAQIIIFIVGLLVCVALNADTTMIVKELWNAQALRSAVVAQAEGRFHTATQMSPEGSAICQGSPTTIEKAACEIREASQPPIGWKRSPGDIHSFPPDPISGAWKVFGLLVSAFAIVLGAPCWFDILNKVVNVRLSGAPPEPST